MATVLSILRRDAQAWWYHRELRERGEVKEAAQRERHSIRENVKALRSARDDGYLMLGRGGWTLHQYKNKGGSACTQGYGDGTRGLPAAARHLGVPVIDTRTIPDHSTLRTIAIPMPVRNPEFADPAPWSGMSFAPLEVVATAYAALGATVHGVQLDPDHLGKLRGFKEAEAKALVAWATGDELGLFDAMMELREEE